MDRLLHCPSAPPPIQGMRALALLAWGCLFLLLPAPLRGEEVLRVGLYENPPKIFTSPSGRPEGIWLLIIPYGLLPGAQETAVAS